MEPVRINIRRHIETAIYHKLSESISVRSTLVIVPSFVKIPNWAEEDLIHAASLVEICAGITIHITCEFLHDDEIRQRLLIEPFSPSIDRICEVG